MSPATASPRRRRRPGLPSLPGPTDVGRAIAASPLADVLTTPHGVDRYLELVRPLWTIGEPRAEVVAVRHQTPRSVTLTLRPNRSWKGMRPGQFVRLAIEIDGVRHERCYSPASPAASPTVEITVGLHENGLVSRHLKREARPGMVVGLSDPDGDFHLPARAPERLLLISGGSGITPVLAMLRTLCDRGHRGEVAFVHYSRTRADACYRAELEAIAAAHPNVSLARSYTREAGAGELDGHLSTAHLESVLEDWADAEAYVCGPPALLDTARELWAGAGCESRLHVESFVPPAFAAPADDRAGKVSFLGSGLSIDGDGRPLLEQAEQAGLSPEHGCRMGICHSCTCTKRSGAVRDLRSGELRTAPDERIRICVSAPVGDVELDL